MPRSTRFGYAAVLCAALIIALAASRTQPALSFDGFAYDWLFKLQAPEPWPTSSAILAIDENSLQALHGRRDLRSALADVLPRIAAAGPTAVAIDFVFADPGTPTEDRALASAFEKTPRVVLASEIIARPEHWEEPLAEFAHHAAAIGHVHAGLSRDQVNRTIPLWEALKNKRRWALSVEAFRLANGAGPIVESLDQIQIGPTIIPIERVSRPALYVRYLRPKEDYASRIPSISLIDLKRDPSLAAQFHNKAVFIGVTAQSEVDRLMTPWGLMMSGVEIHAQAFETMRHGEFLKPAADSAVVMVCAVITLAAGLVFAFLSGGAAYALGAALLIASHAIPHIALLRLIIFPYLAPVLTAWLTVACAASWVHFVVRRQLRKSESDKSRYQEAIQFVTHEMRSPLTAIQGSSEMMGRYNLDDAKRKQMAQTINSESKRLAGMIQTFLDIERLTAGEMQIRSEAVDVPAVVNACIRRVQSLADRKQIELRLERVDPCTLNGDRELIEYAIYNLLTNAIKYSPAQTVVTTSAQRQGNILRLSVADQGIGMDEKELRNIFKKFYRTKKAENSGEVGTGIGLSLVEQIVTQHGGRIEVTSTPGAGSCFTIVLPRGITSASVPASTLVSN